VQEVDGQQRMYIEAGDAVHEGVLDL
jgi:hypothetical protein